MTNEEKIAHLEERVRLLEGQVDKILCAVISLLPTTKDLWLQTVKEQMGDIDKDLK